MRWIWCGCRIIVGDEASDRSEPAPRVGREDARILELVVDGGG